MKNINKQYHLVCLLRKGPFRVSLLQSNFVSTLQEAQTTNLINQTSWSFAERGSPYFR